MRISKSKLNLFLLFLVLVFSGSACSKKKKNNNPSNPNYYGPLGSCGAGYNNGGQYTGLSTAYLDHGAVIDLDMFQMAGNRIYAVGELYIPDMNLFDPAYAPGHSIVECVEGEGTVSYSSTIIGDEITMSLRGNQGTQIMFGSSNGNTSAITTWVNDKIGGQIHMNLGGTDTLELYTLSP